MDVSKIGVPLVMVNGNFRSLHTLNVEELESFVQFMTRCSLKKCNQTTKKSAPKWWARSIDFKFPLRKPRGLSDLGYLRHLRGMVCRCYCFHNANFLITSSSQFAEFPQSIFLKCNPNNTTSVFSVENVAEIFIFDNENKEYDSKPTIKPSWSTLLRPGTSQSSPKMPGDIYLCENCDVEFYNYADMESHEKDCTEPHAEDSSDEIEVLAHIRPPPPEPDEKDVFLDYFGLRNSALQQQEPAQPPRPSEPATPERRWVILDMCLHKNQSIEFSSVLGRHMLKYRVKRDVLSRAEKAIIAARDVCDNSLGTDNFRTMPRPRVTYRTPKKKIWPHSYSFTKKQRIDRFTTLRTGLNKRSRDLLKKCKPLRIKLPYLMLPLDSKFFICLSNKAAIPFQMRACLEWMLELF